ncbi:MAG TPA: helix-turn-helix domain-containing protein [Ktedonobacterales bacterium]|nr:helix-turn-helix domain-containing protein [Ktedonobacterales bacterium]
MPHVSDTSQSPRKGAITRQTILDAAVRLASVEGLETISIGRLAEVLQMSKSGVFAHFGSKQDLQLAALDAALHRFVSEAMQPALHQAAGLPRLWGLCDQYLSYLERRVFPGGCFLLATWAEFDGRPGPLRDAAAAAMHTWHGAIERAVISAQAVGHLDTTGDPAQLAFELNALLQAANTAFLLSNDGRAFDRARVGIRDRLTRLATAQAPHRAAASLPGDT